MKVVYQYRDNCCCEQTADVHEMIRNAIDALQARKGFAINEQQIGDLGWESFGETPLFDAHPAEVADLARLYLIEFEHEWFRRVARADIAALAEDGGDFESTRDMLTIAEGLFIANEQARSIGTMEDREIEWRVYRNEFRAHWLVRREALFTARGTRNSMKAGAR